MLEPHETDANICYENTLGHIKAGQALNGRGDLYLHFANFRILSIIHDFLAGEGGKHMPFFLVGYLGSRRLYMTGQDTLSGCNTVPILRSGLLREG